MKKFEDVTWFLRSNGIRGVGSVSIEIYKPENNVGWYLLKYWIKDFSKMGEILSYFKKRNNTTLLVIYL